MKFFKKAFTLVIAAALLLTGCGKDSNENTLTPTATLSKAETATATATATAMATPTPTEEPFKPDDNNGGGVEEVVKPLPVTKNLIPEKSGTFEDAKNAKDAGWTSMGKVTMSISDKGYEGKCLYFTKETGEGTTYFSPFLDIQPYVTAPGIYNVSFMYKVEENDESKPSFHGVIRTDGKTSFLTSEGGNFFADLDAAEAVAEGDWAKYETSFSVSSKDIGKGGKWRFGIHNIQEDISGIYIDNLELTTVDYDSQAVKITNAVTWVTNEVVLVSDKWYDDPYNDVDVELVLTDGNVTYTVPGFWDGGKIWRIRFVCTSAGTWTYTTKCTDTANKGLHDQKSTVTCKKYTGELDIYKHGFVKTNKDTKYFVHADGTPFFYLGDTHWNLGAEPLNNVKTVIDKRVSQGFTVLQSEPLGTRFNLKDGVQFADIQYFQAFDEKFQYAAEKGLVHVNASLFFPSEMQGFIDAHGGYSDVSKGIVYNNTNAKKVEVFDLSDEAKQALERLCRYWTARYSAYPVMWSLGQEVDNDFYWENSTFNSHSGWSYVNNPYVYVAEYTSKHDAYKSPLSAHQENTSATRALSSAFRDVKGHTFYAAQWSPSLTGGSHTSVAAEYWYNGQGKPVVNYEGRYCYLWTKNFGARAQGWIAYLSGMYGYGYGAQDTWCYLSGYNEDATSNDGVDTITPEDKQNATWQDALEFSSAYQVGYMHSFFKNIVGEWHTLVPRFDDITYLERQPGAYAVVASNENNTKIVAYFYNFSDYTVGERPNSVLGGKKTGTFGKLTPDTQYNYVWFDPMNNSVAQKGTFTSDANGKWFAGEKTTHDMVLYIYK